MFPYSQISQTPRLSPPSPRPARVPVFQQLVSMQKLSLEAALYDYYARVPPPEVCVDPSRSQIRPYTLNVSIRMRTRRGFCF